MIWRGLSEAGDSNAANLNYQLALKHEPDAARAADIRKKLEPEN